MNETGEFIITLHNPLVRRRSINSGLTHVGNYKTENGTISFSISSNEDRDAVVHLNQYYEMFGPDGCMVEKRTVNLNFALMAKNEIERELSDAGFKVGELYGNYDRSEFDDTASPYMIIAASGGLRH